MRRATIDAVLGYFNLLHRKHPTSISLRGVSSSDPLTLPLSLRPTGRRFHTFSCTHSRRHASKMAIDNIRQLEALMNRLDQDRAALQQPADISPRTPNTISTQFNAADHIARQLRIDGHRIWGFVVYRCTYTSDSAWESCIQRINASIQRAMDLYNGRDLLEEGCFKLTVIADASMFDRATTQAVRRHFTEWCARTVYEEQGPREEIESRRQEAPPWDSRLPLRYRFCIQVDEASLQSLISDEGDGWVKLIKGDWESREATRQRQKQHETGPNEVAALDDGEFTDDEDDEVYPAIEGCTEEDVGWMKVQLQSFMPDFYVNLRDPNAWHIEYRRPPDVATA